MTRQTRESTFIEILNKISIEDIDDALEFMLKTKFTSVYEERFVKVLYLYAENVLQDNRDKKMANRFNTLLVIAKGIDKIPNTVVCPEKITWTRKPRETGNSV